MQYWFWLVAISVAVAVAERLAPWRKSQPAWRPELPQDLFWLAFNGHGFAVLADPALRLLWGALSGAFVWGFSIEPGQARLLSALPWWGQLPLAMLAIDFIEWSVHNLLHRLAPLWRLHRVHHSIHIMDWIGNFRFHWTESVIYGLFRYLPLMALGVDPRVGMAAAAIGTTIGHLNHSNLNLSWGPLRFVLNSPRMHLWHHEAELRGAAGVNFGIVFSLWDWLFRTAYLPREALPARIGYSGDERTPRALLWRFFVPFLDQRTHPQTPDPSGRALPS